MKSLDQKIKKIREGTYNPKDFIIADAKDADMAMGRRAPGITRDENGKLTGNFDSFQKRIEISRLKHSFGRPHEGLLGFRSEKSNISAFTVKKVIALSFFEQKLSLQA